ncbi:MAG: ABC transporter ATP-binding protein [Pseudomonadota bacterium]|nr:ABC transporter ATP-binding protein [Pseudomonadota bacterium]MEC8448283.1 ABC transporter ATP-binding protein [Pseudomonadota bacterium]MEC8799029.1 ABC transporter ATP-binding protein [Pseudomonadota bacterium]MED5349003.1 ABC transporter ATP-binding protein [Pseudomonadota bacterium]
MLNVNNLRKEVPSGDGRLIILDDVSLSLNDGESLAITGPSGSGKSTLLSLLAGLDTATSGEIFLDDLALHKMNEEERTALRKEKVGFVFQSFELLPSLTALENVMLPSELKSEKSPETNAKNFLERVGLKNRQDHYPNQLSGGEQQRVAIARAFACSAKILFADEPTGNLDPRNGEIIADLLFEVNSETDNALVIVTHDQELADRCDKTINLKLGKVI